MSKIQIRKDYLKELCLDPDYVNIWIRKWSNLCRNANKNSGSVCKLSFEHYVYLAVAAGLYSPNQIGQHIDDYCMGRIGDIGDYEIGNCRFITQHQNQQERHINGGNDAMIKKAIGRTKYTHSGAAAQAHKISKSFIVVSPTGKVYEGRNLKDFCIKHSLIDTNLGMVCRGLRKHHKGWTGVYLEVKE